MINRRRFLSTASQSVIGAVALTALNRIEGEAATNKLSSIGVQLYTVRAEMAKEFEGSLEKVAAVGYKEVEFAGYYDKSPKDVRAALDRYGLAAPSAHAPLVDIQTKLDQTIETAKAVGHQFLICAYLEENDKDLVKMELDIYWISKAGQDPIAYLGKHKDRFAMFHVKEMDKTPNRGITEVGRGVIDFKSIFAKAPKGAIKHYFVEQDTCPGSPFDSIKISFDYLKQLEF